MTTSEGRRLGAAATPKKNPLVGTCKGFHQGFSRVLPGKVVLAAPGKPYIVPKTK